MRLAVLCCTIAVAGCFGQVADHVDASQDNDGRHSDGEVADVHISDAGMKTEAQATALPLPACSWDTGLYASLEDASSNLCWAARTNTVCTGVSGCTVECLVDDPSQCPGPSLGSCSASSGSGGPPACTDTCKSDEYAVQCQSFGEAPFPQPPSACRADTAAPGNPETEYYCCPCGS
jgi:hypothetical protein